MKKIFFGGTFSVFLLILFISSYGIDYNLKAFKLNSVNFNFFDGNVFGRSIYPKIFCMILTHPGNLKTRAKAVLDAWAKKCDKYKFISVIPEEWLSNANVKISNETKLKGFELDYENISYLQPVNYTIDRYNKLTDKMFQTFKYLYKYYNDFDFYLKADDDTFVFVDNLRKFLSDKNRTSPVTYGWDFHCYVHRGYHSGGAGYVLSNEALVRIGSKLSQNYSFCKYNGGIEDTDVASCLRQVDVYGNKSVDEDGRERFHPINIRSCYEGKYGGWFESCTVNKLKNGSDCCSETQTISFHNMPPEWQLKLKNLTHLNFTTLYKEFIKDLA